MLEIRLQRRKRVRNRPLGGYKTLARGKIEMSRVLQRSFQGEVRLYVEKQTEHVAVVTVGSLTSTVVDVDRRGEGVYIVVMLNSPFVVSCALLLDLRFGDGRSVASLRHHWASGW